jgi:hypothetical protein
MSYEKVVNFQTDGSLFHHILCCWLVCFFFRWIRWLGWLGLSLTGKWPSLSQTLLLAEKGSPVGNGHERFVKVWHSLRLE